jgi:hypothetical protein
MMGNGIGTPVRMMIRYSSLRACSVGACNMGMGLMHSELPLFEDIPWNRVRSIGTLRKHPGPSQNNCS